MAKFERDVRVHDGYVHVESPDVPDRAAASQILALVDEALRESGLRVVLFDSRSTPDPPAPANRTFRAWIDRGRHHDRVAVLVRTDIKRIANNMRAQSKGVEMRSFYDLEEAKIWLTEQSDDLRALLGKGGTRYSS